MINAIRRYPGLLIAVVITLAILLKLGFWQIDRLHEKEALLAAIDAGLHAPVRDFPPEITEPRDWSYKRVRVGGVFDHARELHLFALSVEGRGGYHILTPLLRTDGVSVLVDRGWVPDSRRDPATRAAGQIAGPVTITGIARVPLAPGFLAAKPDVAGNQWFALELQPMSEAIGYRLAPLIVEADATANPGGLPIGGQTRINIPNNHLGYAVTWFGFALVLLVIYSVYISRRR